MDWILLGLATGGLTHALRRWGYGQKKMACAVALTSVLVLSRTGPGREWVWGKDPAIGDVLGFSCTQAGPLVVTRGGYQVLIRPGSPHPVFELWYQHKFKGFLSTEGQLAPAPFNQYQVNVYLSRCPGRPLLEI